MEPDLFEKLRLELRRGSLTLAVLVALQHEHYGYTLRKVLADQGLDIDEGTLYPLLRRLESQGLLASEWRIENGPPRRYYTLSAEGRKLYAELTGSWRNLVETVERLIGEEQSKRRRAINDAR